MTVVSGTPQPPGDAGPRRGGWDPLQMTEVEKRACEREARHDVAARGHRPALETVQHYLAHDRLVHEPSGSTRAGGRPRPSARGAAHPGIPDQPSAPRREPRTGGLLRRLLGR
ncbi:hypothetical protein E9549_20055 [Blastococcus sp. MG754426]|uniref:hypothetical protein n=1 Tax=unclassified Blastococcus TaxID=2619396 RepID=UPI001EF068F1|nr:MULTISPECIES: hypothetical protein [unclassified Blastococcus]MCF6509668.1 hypothetical protein [Blastococcus sp. MG754426]MCF6510731.1 hypothetical protein [Blastococcus sp. MG754427]MCF6737178.1 hypothetical protein [Blastococcus sp. KM273129]